MLEVSLAHVEGLDTEQVACSLTSRLSCSLEGHTPVALLCYAGAHLDHGLLLERIAAAFPETPLAGGTTCGELSSDLGFSEDSAALLAFVGDSLHITAGLGTGLAEDPAAAVRQALEACEVAPSSPPSLCLAFPDGMTGKAEQAVDILGRELGPQSALFGGVPGHLLERPDPARVFCGSTATDNAISLLCFHGPAALAMAISHSWHPLGAPEPVTEARGPKVLRIGDRTALDFYQHYLGKHAVPSAQFPLAVYKNVPQSREAGIPAETSQAKRPYFIRSPYELGKDEGSVIFSADVPAGAHVGITEVTPARILEDTRKVTANIPYPYGGAPAAALVFSCAARKDLLGTRTRKELEILQEQLPEGLPLFGFYSFGEIGPIEQGRTSHLHNCTMLLLLVGEKGYHAEHHLAAPPPQEDICDCALSLSQENLEALRQEIRFVKTKLQRSEAARARMEEARDMDSALMRTVNQELEQVTQELARSEEKHRRIVETAGEGFLLMDEDLVIQYANDAYCRLIGHSREHIQGKRPLELMTKKHRDFMSENSCEILSQDYRRFEISLRHKNGDEVPVLVHANTLSDAAGDILGHVAFVTDLSEQKKALELAGELQQSLMPRTTPEIAGLDIAGRSEPSEEVGGDFFDYMECTHHQDAVSITVGDISGHGVDAALLMSAARAFLRMRAAQPGELDQIITEMNGQLARDLYSSGRFLTLLSVCVDPCRCGITCVRAGHDAPIIYDPHKDSFREPGEPALPLGVETDTVYTASRIEGLPKGSVLVIGTDGIWEARNKQGEMFGKERLREVVRAAAAKSAEDILEDVFQAVETFGKGVKADDDRTLVIARLRD